MARLGRVARKAARWIRGRFSSGALILVYHRIAEIPGDPQLLGVAPERFAEHLEVLRKAARPMRLLDLARDLRDGTIPARAVVLTFDDGYADNLYAAKPLLERFDVPATVYVTTGFIGATREFWWDELDRLLLRPETLPESLSAEIGGATLRWVLSEPKRPNNSDLARRRGWSVAEPRDPGPRQRAYRELCAVLRGLRAPEQDALLERLATWSGGDRRARETHRALTAEEVRRIAEGGLVDVGPHTVTHPVLSSLPGEEQRREIQDSRRDLEGLVGRRVESFAYPYGDKSSYDAGTVALIQDAGFSCACANEPDSVHRGADRFRLPRFVVRDWDREEFAGRLEGWFGGG